MKNVTIMLAVVAVLAMAVPAHGAWLVSNWTGGTESWHQSTNPPWGGDGEPVSGSGAWDVTIENGGIAQISEDFKPRKFALYVGEYDGTGSVEMLAAGDYTVQLGYEGDAGTNKLKIGVYGNAGTFTVYGGTLDGSRTLFLIGANGLFKVVGSGSAGITVEKYWHFDNGATLAYEINGNSTGGIETIAVSGEAIFDGDLVITSVGDLTESKYVLMAYGSKSGTFDNVDISALPAGWSIEYGDGDGHSEKEVWLVPEPATMALLGIGGIGVLIRKRRK